MLNTQLWHALGSYKVKYVIDSGKKPRSERGE